MCLPIGQPATAGTSGYSEPYYRAVDFVNTFLMFLRYFVWFV